MCVVRLCFGLSYRLNVLLAMRSELRSALLGCAEMKSNNIQINDVRNKHSNKKARHFPKTNFLLRYEAASEKHACRSNGITVLAMSLRRFISSRAK